MERYDRFKIGNCHMLTRSVQPMGGTPYVSPIYKGWGKKTSFTKNCDGTGAEIAKLLDFRSNPGLTSRVSELEIGSNNCPSGAFRSDPLET